MMQQISNVHSLHSCHHPHTTLNFVNEGASAYPPVTESPNTTSRNNYSLNAISYETTN